MKVKVLKVKEVDLNNVKEKFFERTKLLRDLTNTSIRTISNNTRYSYKKLKQFEVDKLLPDAELLLIYSDYFSISADFLLGLIDDYDLSDVEPFVPTPNYLSANFGSIEFDECFTKIDYCPNILKDLREEAGLTQTKLAELLNISKNTFSKLENKLYPPVEFIIKLSDFYDVTIDYLLGRTMNYNEIVIGDDEIEISEQDSAAGAVMTRKASITPIEDELLHVFRELGKKHGEPTQRGIIDMIEKMCD